MKFWHNYKTYKFNQKLKTTLYINSFIAIIAVGAIAGGVIGTAAAAAYKSWPKLISLPIQYPGSSSKSDSSKSNSKTKKSKSRSFVARSNSKLSQQNSIDQSALIFEHSNIVTTTFWVGELADSDNGYIPNAASAWDEQWQAHYGGVDSPTNRKGYLPAAFTPKENPFYFALPYSDLTDNGKRKPTANQCPNSGIASLAKYSWCKNAWIAIKKGNKVVYAQWEDVGPFEEDDTAYVFGSATPKNKQDAKAGLDVSPAVYDYLGLNDVDNCSWTFVSSNNVLSGPWSQIITSSKGTSVN